jgi:hypothetical protein
MKRSLVMLAAAAAALGGAAARAAPGDELAGNSAEALRSDGTRLRILFGRDGIAQVSAKWPGHGFTSDGPWTLADGRLCWDLRNKIHECWAYPEQLMYDAPTELRSADSGLTLRFTARYGTGAVMPPAASGRFAQ